jgi:xylulokinase
MRYIGLDVGTSGCKATVADKDGVIFTSAYREYAPVCPQPGYMEIDARLVADAVMQVLREVASPEITALSIASFGEAVVLLDGQDRVLERSIYFSDTRGVEEVADILAAMDQKRCRQITGMPANPMFSANKLLWIKKHKPDVFAAAKRTLLFGDYVAFTLTGERMIDYSLASRTMLLDIHTNSWSDEVADALGLSTAGFSRPVRMGTPIGKLLPKVAKETGLNENVLVVAGGHDQAMAALGSGATKPGDSVDGMGSSECITLVLGKENIVDKMADYSFCAEPYLFDNTYITLAFNASAGSAIRWFRDCFGAELAQQAKAGGESVYQMLERECPAKPTEILFLPYVAGSGTPYLDSEIGGAFLGLRMASTRSELYRAVLQGICYEMQMNAALLKDCGIALNAITAVGGGSNSELLMQIKADVMNREIDVLETSEAGTLGLILLCSQAMGEIDDLAVAARRIAKRSRTFVPNPENVRIYASLMERYSRVYPALRTVCEK